jgi:hypothetical protein
MISLKTAILLEVSGGPMTKMIQLTKLVGSDVRARGYAKKFLLVDMLYHHRA